MANIVAQQVKEDSRMAFDPDDEFAPDIPIWLSRFVANQIRPTLLQNRQAALDGLQCWLAFHESQLSQAREWEARQNEYLREMSFFTEEERGERQEQAPGADWCERWRDPLTAELRLVQCWLPPELSETNRPRVDCPLPPPRHRDLSDAECWAALLAVHDSVRDSREALGDSDSLPFAFLIDGVQILNQEHLPELQAILMRVVGPEPRAELEAESQYVTLDQMAAMVNRSKKTLERELNDPNSSMPRPDIEGGGGNPHEWKWTRIRPWLEKTYSRTLPERFPDRY